MILLNQVGKTLHPNLLHPNLLHSNMLHPNLLHPNLMILVVVSLLAPANQVIIIQHHKLIRKIRRKIRKVVQPVQLVKILKILIISSQVYQRDLTELEEVKIQLFKLVLLQLIKILIFSQVLHHLIYKLVKEPVKLLLILQY